MFRVKAYRGKNPEFFRQTFVRATSAEKAKEVGRQVLRAIFGVRGKFAVTANEYLPQYDLDIREWVRPCA